MKKISIEALLTWAFTVELPKVGATEGGAPSYASGSAAFSEMVALGTLVDRSPNNYGVLSSFTFEGNPHPDAILVGDVVRGLAHRDFEIADGWYPFPEWNDEHGIIRTEVARIAGEQVARGSVNGRHVVSLVTSAAVLKRGPDWTAREPKVVMLTNAGRPAWFVTRKCKDRTGKLVSYEDNGFDQRKGKPMKGAYRKHRLDEPVRAAVIARMEWQIWQSALEVLHNGLSRYLSAHELLPFYPVMQPWATLREVETKTQAIDIAAE